MTASWDNLAAAPCDGRLAGCAWLRSVPGEGRGHSRRTAAAQRAQRAARRLLPPCSCEGANKGGVLSGEMRRNPHVQSYVVATDQVGPGWLVQLEQGQPRRLRGERSFGGPAGAGTSPWKRFVQFLSADSTFATGGPFPRLLNPACHPAPCLQIGLRLLQAEGGVLKCYTDIHDAIWWACWAMPHTAPALLTRPAT